MQANPDRKLSNMLRQNDQELGFKNAKRLLKYLKKDIEGLPALDAGCESNLYNFVLRRGTEASVSQYKSHAKQIKRRQSKNNSFNLEKQPDDLKLELPRRLRFGSGKTGQRRSIRKQAAQEVKFPVRRKSCNCADCGQESQKICRLKFRGSNNNQKMAYGRFVKMRRTFYQECMDFSQKLDSRKLSVVSPINSSKRSPTMRLIGEAMPLKRRCNSSTLSKDWQVQVTLFKGENTQRKSIQKSRQSLLGFKRQQTINDRMMLIPLRMTTTQAQEDINSKRQQETKISKASLPQIQKNNSEYRKQNTKIFVPLSPKNNKLMTTFSQSTIQMYQNKSINKQLQLQVKHSFQVAKKSFNKDTSTSSIKQHTFTCAYRSVKTDFMRQLKRRARLI